MWGTVEDRKQWLERVVEFTGNDVLYGEWMLKVTEAWPYSCEHNLSKLDTNPRAWIGHAAVAMAIQCPEDIVREAWGYLSKEQQDLANMRAQEAINNWRMSQCLRLV